VLKYLLNEIIDLHYITFCITLHKQKTALVT